MTDEKGRPCIDGIELNSVEYQSEPEGTVPIGAVVLSYTVRFYQNANQPGLQSFAAFKGADAKWKVGHHNAPSDDVVDAEQTIDVES